MKSNKLWILVLCFFTTLFLLGCSKVYIRPNQSYKKILSHMR